jgi:hypothetical protein
MYITRSKNDKRDMYHLTQVADLPVPLHGARMELLADVPTLIGGYDGDNQQDNDVIYQVLIV